MDIVLLKFTPEEKQCGPTGGDKLTEMHDNTLYRHAVIVSCGSSITSVLEVIMLPDRAAGQGYTVCIGGITGTLQTPPPDDDAHRESNRFPKRPVGGNALREEDSGQSSDAKR